MQHIPQIEVEALGTDRTGFQPGEIEQLVDEGEEVRAGVANEPDVLPQAGLIALGDGKLSEPEDGGQWRSDFVRNGREKAGLGCAGLGCCPDGLGLCSRNLHPLGDIDARTDMPLEDPICREQGGRPIQNPAPLSVVAAKTVFLLQWRAFRKATQILG